MSHVQHCIVVKVAKVARLYIMNILSKKCLFLLNITAGCVILLIVISRFQDTDIFALRVQKYARSDGDAVTSSIVRQITSSEKLKVPWRFQIEEDGFVFPFKHAKEKYVAYDPVNGSWSDQILQFENAVVIAYLLKRTLLAPPLLPHKLQEEHYKNTFRGEERVPLFNILDSDVLSKKVKVKDLHKIQVGRLNQMSKRYVCLDSRLGFWLDYIPSVENIQTWRLLRQQEFPLVDINDIKNDAKCPETIFGRWTYPKKAKPMYRGILTELTKIEDDVIYFNKDTLAHTYLRIFDKQRAIELQDLLLLYIRFTPAINSRLKILINVLGSTYTAVVLNSFNTSDIDSGAMDEMETELQIVDSNNLTKTIFASGNASKQTFLRKFSNLNRRVVFANEFVTENINVLDGNVHPDKVELFEQLLSGYADILIPQNMTSDTYFIRHLRTKELFTTNGIAIDNVNVRWAKHTTKQSVANFQKEKVERTRQMQYILQNEKTILQNATSYNKMGVTSLSQDTNLTSSTRKTDANQDGDTTTVSPLKQGDNKAEKLVSVKGGAVGRRSKDQLSHMVCLFCNYIRHITGHHGCPTMKELC